jgi:hypothetical protein
VAALTNGYCFGEHLGTVTVLKTIISEEMLFEKQKKIFKSLQKRSTRKTLKDSVKFCIPT